MAIVVSHDDEGFLDTVVPPVGSPFALIGSSSVVTRHRITYASHEPWCIPTSP